MHFRHTNVKGERKKFTSNSVFIVVYSCALYVYLPVFHFGFSTLLNPLPSPEKEKTTHKYSLYEKIMHSLCRIECNCITKLIKCTRRKFPYKNIRQKWVNFPFFLLYLFGCSVDSLFAFECDTCKRFREFLRMFNCKRRSSGTKRIFMKYTQRQTRQGTHKLKMYACIA